MRQELAGLNVAGSLKKDGVDVATVDDLVVRNFLEKSANYGASVGDVIASNTVGGSFNITLPANPNEFDAVGIFDAQGSFKINNLIVLRNGKAIMGLAEDMTVDVDNASFQLIYNNGDWRLV